jgi:hypothetical protein
VYIYDTNVTVQTFAGSGFTGYYDGVAVETMFYTPYDICVDSKSNFFVSDLNNYRIRKITPDAVVTTFLGGGTGSPQVGTNAALTGPPGRLAIDCFDNLWFADGGWLAKVTPDAVLMRTNLGVSMDYFSGFACDSTGNVYFASGQRIMRYTTNCLLETFVGSGNVGYQDGTGIFTAFNEPRGLAFDQADNLFVADSLNWLIRKITPSRVVSTYAGTPHVNDYRDGPSTNASFHYLGGIAADSAGNVFVAGEWNVRRISPQGTVTTVAGSDVGGFQNGAGNIAQFQGIINLVVTRSGDTFTPDRADQRIRRITAPQVLQVSNSFLSLHTYAGLTVTGNVGRTYRIESSSVVNTNWTTETTIALPSSPYLWFDPTPIASKKFYRAFLLP